MKFQALLAHNKKYKLPHLELINGFIEADEQLLLLECIKVGGYLTSLKLANNSLLGDGANPIFAALIGNKTICRFAFTGNLFTHDFAVLLAAAISHRDSSFTYIDLSSCVFERGAVAKLFESMHSSIKPVTLIFRSSLLRYDDVAAIRKWVSVNHNVVSLDLTGNVLTSIMSGSIASMLVQNLSLRELTLKRCSLGNAEFSAILQASRFNRILTMLNLDNNEIDDTYDQEYAKFFTHNHTLSSLSLAANKLKWNEIKKLLIGLGHNHSLTSLDLSYNYIEAAEDDDVEDFIFNPENALTSINVYGNLYPLRVVTSLLRSLSTLKTKMKQLNFGYCMLGPNSVIKFCDLVIYHSTLTHLELSCWGMNSLNVVALVQALSTNEVLAQLNLSHNAITEVGARAIQKLIATKPTLTDLDMMNNEIGDAGAIAIFEVVAQRTHFFKLNLIRNQITDVAVSAISHMLQTNRSLRQLDLSYNEFSEASIITILEALHCKTSLEIFNLHGIHLSTQFAQAVIAMLRDNHVLNILNCIYVDVNPELIQQIQKLFRINKQMMCFLQEIELDIFAAYHYISEVITAKQGTVKLSPVPNLLDIALSNYLRLLLKAKPYIDPDEFRARPAIDVLYRIAAIKEEPVKCVGAKRSWVKLSLFNSQEISTAVDHELTATSSSYILKIDI